MERQSCLLGAIVRQVDLGTVLTRYADVLAATSDAVRTDITRPAARALIDLAVKVRGRPIERLAFIPPVIPDTTNPDFVRIRALVRTAIAGTGPATAVPTTAVPEPTASNSASRTPAPGAVDLAGVC